MKVDLVVEDCLLFFTNATKIRLTVYGTSDLKYYNANTITAGVLLPPNATLVQGNLSFTVALYESELPITLEGMVRATLPGTHVLRGYAYLDMPPADLTASAESVGIRGGSDGAEFFDPPDLSNKGFSVELRTNASDVADLQGAITSIVEAPVNVQLWLPRNFTLVEGQDNWTGVLHPNETLVFDYRVTWNASLPQGGYHLRLWVLPDLAYHGGIYRDGFSYWWDGEEMSLW